MARRHVAKLMLVLKDAAKGIVVPALALAAAVVVHDPQAIAKPVPACVVDAVALRWLAVRVA